MNVVIDYDTGSIGSLLNRLRKAGAPAVLSRDAESIRKATRLFLPGGGAFDTGMGNLNSPGLFRVLGERVLGAGVPVPGIGQHAILENGARKRFRWESGLFPAMRLPLSGIFVISPGVPGSIPGQR